MSALFNHSSEKLHRAISNAGAFRGSVLFLKDIFCGPVLMTGLWFYFAVDSAQQFGPLRVQTSNDLYMYVGQKPGVGTVA